MCVRGGGCVGTCCGALSRLHAASLGGNLHCQRCSVCGCGCGSNAHVAAAVLLVGCCACLAVWVCCVQWQLLPVVDRAALNLLPCMWRAQHAAAAAV